MNQQDINLRRIKSLSNVHKGKIGWLVGNGPSVKTDELNLLHDFVTFGCNRLYLVYDQMKFRPSYLCSTDKQVIQDFGQEMVSASHGNVFFVAENDPKLNGEYIWFKMKSSTPLKFSTNVADHVMPGAGTLITAIQIGYHMGITKYYIYGMDHNFKYNEDKAQSDPYRKGTGDGNHFIPNYRSGKAWGPPVYKQVEGALLSCLVFLQSRGGWIKNATNGGNLEILDRINFFDAVNETKNI